MSSQMIKEQQELYPERRVKLTIEYDGTDFCGWQVQPEHRTVQGELENALKRLTGQKVTIYGSGRTDSGVHAIGQIAHITLPESKFNLLSLQKSLNGLTGKDIYVRDAEVVPDDFHARFDAKSRRYKYRLLKHPHPMLIKFSDRIWDDKIARETSKKLKGKHSFKSFSRKREGEVDYKCEIFDATWTPTYYGASFEVEADRFFHQMVRGLVGAIIDVARGYLSNEEFLKLLHNPENNAEVRFVPPQGLVLLEVKY
mgnify:CR=1 FL=1